MEKFTAKYIESLKPSTREQTLSEKISALSIRITKSGAYYFFRHKRFGKIQIGPVSDLSLAEARDTANHYKSLTRKGINPRDAKPSKQITLSEAYELFISSKSINERKPNYVYVFKLRCQKYLIPRLGKYHLTELSEDVVTDFWKWLKANADGRNTDNTAKQVIAHLSSIIQWANETLPGVSLKSNPTNFRKNFKQQTRQRVFSNGELKLIIREFKNLPSPFQQFMMCVLLTGIRNGELALMRWSEIERDVPASTIQPNEKRKLNIWNCPHTTSKSAEPIKYVLSDEVLSYIDSLPRINAFVFTTGRGIETHITSQSKEAAKIRSKLAFNDPWTLHDLRRTLVTYLSESGVPAAEIDRFIGKRVSEGAASHAAYDFAPRLMEKKRVAEAWAITVRSLFTNLTNA